jgi:hypothetical protein
LLAVAKKCKVRSVRALTSNAGALDSAFAGCGVTAVLSAGESWGWSSVEVGGLAGG